MNLKSKLLVTVVVVVVCRGSIVSRLKVDLFDIFCALISLALFSFMFSSFFVLFCSTIQKRKACIGYNMWLLTIGIYDKWSIEKSKNWIKIKKKFRPFCLECALIHFLRIVDDHEKFRTFYCFFFYSYHQFTSTCVFVPELWIKNWKKVCENVCTIILIRITA